MYFRCVKKMRILYSICGIGLGHATRSNEIIESIKKENELIIACPSHIKEFINKDCKEIIEIDFIELSSSTKSYDFFKTFKKNAGKIPKIFKRNFELFDEKAFNVDLVITDHEITSFLWAKTRNKKTILISNVHGIFYSHLIDSTFNPLKIFYTLPLDFLPTTITSFADIIINTHIYVPKKKKFLNTYFFGPIIDSKIIKKKKQTTKKNKILVYLPTEVAKKTLEELKKIEEIKDKKIIFSGEKKLKREEFIKELSESDFFICHGGLNSLSEALYLKKPVLVIADPTFYERYFNGSIAANLNYGKIIKKPERKEIIEFIKRIPEFEQQLNLKPVKASNKQIIRFLKKAIKKLTKKESLKEKIKKKLKLEKIKEITKKLKNK